MTDQLDFEARLEARLRAHTADVGRSFDAAAISASAAAMARRRPWDSRAGWRPLGIRLTPKVTAVLLLGLLVALVGGVLLAGSRPISLAVVAPTASAAPAAPTPGPSLRVASTGYPGTGTIAFTRLDPTIGATATWLIDPAGSHESAFRVATVNDGAVGPPTGTGCCAVISPDGKSIAVGYDAVNPFGPFGTRTRPVIWRITRIMNLDGSEVTKIPAFCGGCGSANVLDFVPRAWSPDRSLVATENWSDADPSRDGIGLAPTCTISCDKTVGPVCVEYGCDWYSHATGDLRDVPVAFDPDGKKLLFVRIGHDGLGALMVLTIGPPSPRTDSAPIGAIQQISPDGMLVFADGSFGPRASWSPDGSRIAFAATDPSGDVRTMRAYVVAASGGSPIPLTAAGPSVSTASWSPDGTWIAFDRAIPGTGTHDLFVVHPDGTGETNLTTDFEPSMCCARWSPDSRALLTAGTVTENERQLFIVPISGGPIYQVTTTPGLYSDFSWGPASR